MTRRVRQAIFFAAAAGLAFVFFFAYHSLPPLGSIQSRYGDTVNAITVPERHITDAVTAVNFDIRGFDTLGEEFIFFTSVIGTVLLMRRQKDEPTGDHEDKAPRRVIPRISDAIRVTSLTLVPVTVLFGIYIVTHGQVSPGGGFQGGVILASAPLLVYLCTDYKQFRTILPLRLVAVSECIGASAYILIGGLGLILGGVFLQNVLPLGLNGSITGGGIVALIDAGVGMEVAGGLSTALLVYLEELVEEKEE